VILAFRKNSASMTISLSDSRPIEAEAVMHAEAIVTRFVEQAWAAIHGTRRRVLAAMVWAAMCGTVVSLSRLARGVVGAGRAAKAALKRLDRLVGHARIERQVDVLAQAILMRLARWMDPWVIAVDWSAVTPGRTFVALRAAVVWSGMGRGLQVCQRVYPAKLQGNGKAERSFLRDLSRMILRGTRVIVISEAGLPTPWFRAVTRPGRGWIGRVRRGNQVRRGDGLWRDALGFGQRAAAQAVRMSDCELTCKQRLACDLVMVRRAPVGRKAYCRPGHGPLPEAAGEARRSARESWVLAPSIDQRDRRPATGRDRGVVCAPDADRGELSRHQVAGLRHGDRDRPLALGPAPSSIAADRETGSLSALAPGPTRRSRRHGQALQGDRPHHARAIDRRAGDPCCVPSGSSGSRRKRLPRFTKGCGSGGEKQGKRQGPGSRAQGPGYRAQGIGGFCVGGGLGLFGGDGSRTLWCAKGTKRRLGPEP